MGNDFGLEQSVINKLNDILSPHKNYIEITQDAAAFCSSTGNISGVFTGGVETCIIWVVRYENGFLMVHDSGQLLLTEIVALIKSYGNPLVIAIHHGLDYSENSHKSRVSEICNQLGYANSPMMLNSKMASFGVLQENDGGYEYCRSNIKPHGLVPLPDYENRINIVYFNNFFLEPSSQSLKIDLQYDGEHYLHNTHPLHSVESVLSDIASQPGHFYNNLMVLYPIVNKDIVQFPEWCKAFINNYLDPKGHVKESKKYEAALHKRFVDLKCLNI
ncbi:hypothetical protein [Enterobacter sp.]|uniref:hypothetical protein n=1 Tax=Enterobacter sp. TaxID=42895 RepID=UPI00296E9D31|nr:hypothetical protein [Enterobacter sp.]